MENDIHKDYGKEIGWPSGDDSEVKKFLYARFHTFKMKKQPICKAWNVFPNFYNWAIENGYQIGAKLYRYDANEPYSPENCCWHMMISREKNVSEKEVREAVNRWNRTVNVIREHYGMEPFPLVEEQERVGVYG